MNDQKIQLSLSLVNGVLQYLGSRPYVEVAPLIEAIQIQAIQEQAIPQPPVPDVASEPAPIVN